MRWIVILLSLSLGGYLRRRPAARRALLVLSVATLWYLTIGTVHCVLVAALLLGVPSLRERA